jgi:hypothetical protein
MLIRGEPLHRQPDIGAEASPRRVEALEEFAFHGRCEESLRQVFSSLVVLAEFEADEFVDGFQ